MPRTSGACAAEATAIWRPPRTSDRVTASAARCSPSRISAWVICLTLAFAPERCGRHDHRYVHRTAILNLRSIIPSRHTRRAWYYGLGARLGLYRQYGPADRGEVRRLVFVCKGNICRSPFAEAVARAAGADAVSYGLDARDGLPANPSAIRTARKFGLVA